jgi:hypothetical protein
MKSVDIFERSLMPRRDCIPPLTAPTAGGYLRGSAEIRR